MQAEAVLVLAHNLLLLRSTLGNARLPLAAPLAALQARELATCKTLGIDPCVLVHRN